jgi:transcription elongation GreA/GreB family factor
MIPYQKPQLLQQLITQLERNAGLISRAAENVRQDVINAEGRMQTRYGSEKEETGYLADGLSQRNQEILRGLDVLKAMPLPQSPQKVERGCLVRLNDGHENSDYFILPYGGGESLPTEHGEVTIISTTAPLSKAMLSKSKGEQFNGIGQRKYTIVDFL